MYSQTSKSSQVANAIGDGAIELVVVELTVQGAPNGGVSDEPSSREGSLKHALTGSLALSGCPEWMEWSR